MLAGIVLLARPHEALDAISHDDLQRRWVVAARVLGVRHLVEAAAITPRPDPRFAEIGALIDGTHALVAAGFGALDPRRRRLTWFNAVIAAAFGAAGVHHARSLARRSS